jgi:two-component system sensor histidine kinase MtrB
VTTTRSRPDLSPDVEAHPAAEPAREHSRPRAGWRRTLRGRATLAFTAVTVVLCSLLTIAVWVAVSGYLLVQRERITLVQASDNAAQVERALGTEGLTVPQILAQLPRETGSVSLYVDDDQWVTTSLLIGREDVPAGLAQAVLGGAPARQRIGCTAQR